MILPYNRDAILAAKPLADSLDPAELETGRYFSYRKDQAKLVNGLLRAKKFRAVPYPYVIWANPNVIAPAPCVTVR